MAGAGTQLQGPMRNCPAMYPCGAWALSWAPARAASAVLPGTINSPTRLFYFYLLRRERRTPANKNIVSIRNYSLEMTGKIQFLQFIRLAGAVVWVVVLLFFFFFSSGCCFFKPILLLYFYFSAVWFQARFTWNGNKKKSSFQPRQCSWSFPMAELYSAESPEHPDREQMASISRTVPPNNPKYQK